MPSTLTVVTGGAGFLGAHVCAALLDRGTPVMAVDDLSTGREAALAGLSGREGFSFLQHDVTEPLPIDGDVGAVIHLACPASPVWFLPRPVRTVRTGALGTLHALELAHRAQARFVLASSSEVYGDPQVHPQAEDYHGNVDPIGPRSAYDEGKRFGEAATFAYQREHGLDVAVVRPFNVYGPGMWPDDGRVIAAFCAAALRDEALPLNGDGSQTRSLCYVSDFVDGLLAVLDSGETGPFNLGSEHEITMRHLAETIIELSGTGKIEFRPARASEPAVRRPDASKARRVLGWSADTPLNAGLARTLDWMRDRLADLPVGGR
jgi:dTDP-glucose 4,6-dehydratase